MTDSNVNSEITDAGRQGPADGNWKRRTAVFLASQTISLFGSSVVGYIVIWYITLETSSGLMMTISTLCNFLPRILVSLFAGVLADKVNRKLIIMLSDGFIAVSTLVLAILFLNGHSELWLLFVVSAVRSVGTGFQTPAVNAAIPQIVPTEKLTRVNGINTSMVSITELAAPALGGLLLTQVGFAWGILFDVITAAVAIAIMSVLRLGAPENAENQEPVLRQIAEGLRYAGESRLFRALGIFYAVTMFCVAPSAFLTPVMLERNFGQEVWRLSVNEMVWSVGALAGGLLIGVWPGFKKKLRTVALSSVGFAICFMMLGAGFDFWVFIFFMGLAALFVTYFSTTLMVIFQTQVEPAMRGRFFSLMSILNASMLPAGMLIFGPMGDVVSIESILLWTGAALLFAAGIFVVRMESKAFTRYNNL